MEKALLKGLLLAELRKGCRMGRVTYMHGCVYVCVYIYIFVEFQGVHELLSFGVPVHKLYIGACRG